MDTDTNFDAAFDDILCAVVAKRKGGPLALCEQLAMMRQAARQFDGGCPLTLRESYSLTSSRIDRSNCVVRGVRVCGLRSSNGRTYTPAALREALPMYESVGVFFGRPEGESGPRRIEDRFGRLVNVRVAFDGAIEADLAYNPRHRLAEQFLWAAENDHRNVGLSHDARGTGRRGDDGEMVVDRITRVLSVDVVDAPASVSGLF